MQQILVIVLSAAASLISGLVLYNLNKLSEKIEKHDDDIRTLEQSMSKCKIDCDRTFVESELFLRETGFARRSMEKVSSSINQVIGKLDIVDKFPKICGEISRSIVEQMQKRGDPQ